MHKFLKSLEGLGLKSALEEDSKRENANIDGQISYYFKCFTWNNQKFYFHFCFT